MKKINFKLIILFMATAGLLVFLHGIGWLRPLESGLYWTLNPAAAKLQSWASAFNSFYRRQSSPDESPAAVAELKRKIEALTASNADLKKLEDENVSLRQYLRFFKDKDQQKYVLANVVSREAFSGAEENYGKLAIDKGRADGIVPGLAVVNERGMVVGKVLRVEEKISHVSITTDSSCKLAASLQNKDRTVGVTGGNLGLTINMDFIPQAEQVASGDLVVTSGLEPNIARGLVIGRVIKVDKDSNEIWQNVVIEPLVDFNDLIIVSVLIP